MAVTNNAMIIRRDLLTRIAKLLKNDQLVEQIDRIPIEIRPKDGGSSRCCIYKDRAMLRFKIRAMLGFSLQDNDDEITPLSAYARKAFERKTISPMPLTVVDEACSACVKSNYVVTNMCRGCVARPCMVNCNKNAIQVIDGRADIDHKKCVNCGLCMKNCPFHAIIYVPVPCEESCPVEAITKDSEGIEHIDPKKCIYCGKCMVACPFGAIMEKSHFIEIFSAIKSPKKVVAMVAPAIAGQFRAKLENILGAIRQLGFDHVIEVARGADLTTTHEAEEFKEKMAEGQPFMTTSCCPSYTSLVNKHLPEIKPFVSTTGTPLHYTAEIARKSYPDAVLVFIGPCLAKRHEAYHDPNTDYMLSFEEIGAMFVAGGIDVSAGEAVEIDSTIHGTSRGYANTSGVMTAVKTKLGDSVAIRPAVINGLDKPAIKELRGYAVNCPANMVEVMACEGGCVNGCNVIANPKIAARQVKEVSERQF